MTSEIEYKCNNCGHEGLNTRAVPDVPELVRYAPATLFDGAASATPTYNGSYVRYDQAAAMLAAKDAEIDRFTVDECEFGHKYAKMTDHPHKDGRPQCPNCLSIGLTRARDRAEASEADLAQIKAQKPVAWMHPTAGWTDVSKDEVSAHCKHGTDPKPLFAAPVDQAAEIERLRAIALSLCSHMEMVNGDLFDRDKPHQNPNISSMRLAIDEARAALNSESKK